jgi:hypothetical protein
VGRCGHAVAVNGAVSLPFHRGGSWFHSWLITSQDWLKQLLPKYNLTVEDILLEHITMLSLDTGASDTITTSPQQSHQLSPPGGPHTDGELQGRASTQGGCRRFGGSSSSSRSRSRSRSNSFSTNMGAACEGGGGGSSSSSGGNGGRRSRSNSVAGGDGDSGSGVGRRSRSNSIVIVGGDSIITVTAEPVQNASAAAALLSSVGGPAAPRGSARPPHAAGAGGPSWSSGGAGRERSDGSTSSSNAGGGGPALDWLGPVSLFPNPSEGEGADASQQPQQPTVAVAREPVVVPATRPSLGQHAGSGAAAVDAVPAGPASSGSAVSLAADDAAPSGGVAFGAAPGAIPSLSSVATTLPAIAGVALTQPLRNVGLLSPFKPVAVADAQLRSRSRSYSEQFLEEVERHNGSSSSFIQRRVPKMDKLATILPLIYVDKSLKNCEVRELPQISAH